MGFNPHASAVNIIKNCVSYYQVRKILKKYWLTKSEQKTIIRMAEEKFQRKFLDKHQK